jgi:hypothetical protein
MGRVCAWPRYRKETDLLQRNVAPARSFRPRAQRSSVSSRRLLKGPKTSPPLTKVKTLPLITLIALIYTDQMDFLFDKELISRSSCAFFIYLFFDQRHHCLSAVRC